MDWLYDLVTGGSALNVQIQTYRTPFLDFFFKTITFLGNEEFYLLVLPLFYWAIQKDFGRKLAYTFLASTYLNVFLKGLFVLPRPFQVNNQIVPLVEKVDYSMPSGHAQIPITIWGYAAWHWRRSSRWFGLIVVILAILLSFSRLYLGVHFVADVLVGLTVGLLTLILWIRYQPSLARWLNQLSDRQQLLLAVIVPVILMFIARPDAAGYPAEDIATITGVFLGTNLGFFYEIRRLGFKSEGRWWQKGLRYLLGMIIILLIWGGLRIAFGSIETAHTIEMVLRFMRYAMTGWAVAWLAPAAFVRLGLADQEKPAIESAG